jgi:hypothetical protein
VREEDSVANSDCRMDVPANLPRPPLRRAGAQTHHCVGLWRVLGCVLFACELEVDGLSARVEDAERLGEGLRGGGTLRIVVRAVCAAKLACRLIRPSFPGHCNSLDSR